MNTPTSYMDQYKNHILCHIYNIDTDIYMRFLAIKNLESYGAEFKKTYFKELENYDIFYNLATYYNRIVNEFNFKRRKP
jgi:hypothetical protein